jgi:hypothetical protein
VNSKEEFIIYLFLQKKHNLQNVFIFILQTIDKKIICELMFSGFDVYYPTVYIVLVSVREFLNITSDLFTESEEADGILSTS